jgi:hypothetical protein
MQPYKTIIFDIGGVCVGSPLQGVAKYEKQHNLPKKYINVAIEKSGESGAFQRLERGELSIPEFYEIFGKELSDPINKEYYLKYLQSRKGKDTLILLTRLSRKFLSVYNLLLDKIQTSHLFLIKLRLMAKNCFVQ